MRNSLGKSMFLLFYGMIMAEASITCTCVQCEDKTCCSTLLHNKAYEDCSWKVNGTVVAHSQNSNQELVKDYGPEQITFKAVQTTVQYSCGRDTFSCEDVIPTQPSSQGMKNNDSTGHGVPANHTIVIVAIIIIIIVIAAIPIVVLCRKRHRRELCRYSNPTNPTENSSSC